MRGNNLVLLVLALGIAVISSGCTGVSSVQVTLPLEISAGPDDRGMGRYSRTMFGAVAALRGSQDCVESMRREFERRRDYIIPAFSDLGYATAPADGAFYAYVNVGGDDMAIARSWLHDAHVAVTPGTAFGTPGWLRVSYATSMENLEEAIGRIARV